MPWYSKQYVEQLIGDNGELDINKFPEELKSLVGYRIPTEDAYSMMPLYIKGFLPQNSGSAIMLPAEITTIAGCDFDIDKLYFIAPEFTINNNKISKIQVDVNTPEELKNCSVEQRNNLLLDMLTSILQHPDTIAKSMNPGGFDKWIDAMNKYKSEKSSFNSLDPTTQVELHQQNMGAKKLIGIFANHNVNHSLLQNTDTHINDDFKFTYNNKVFTQLNQIKSKEGHYISRTLAGLVASSVDAIKQPVLGTLNINTFTADTACLLARLGYNEFEVAALLVHPAIKEVVDRYMKIQNTAPIKANIIKDVIDDYSKLLSTPQSNDIKDKPFLVEELDRDTKLGLTLQDFKDNKEDSQELIKHHIEVLSLYDKISTIAEDLSDVVSILKSDTSNGGAGPSIADNINKLDKIIDFSLSRETPDAKIIGLEPFVNGILDVYNNDYTQTDLMDYDKMREHIYKNSLAYPLAFNLYGVQSTIPLFFKYFPQYSDNFRNLVRSFKDLTKSEKINVKTMNDIYNDYFSYIASSINSFGGEANEILNKNNYYINEFPKEFKSLLESKKYADNSFISKLAVSKIKGTEIEKIWFNNVGKLTPSTRESVMDGWNSLLYGNEEDKKLAKNLFFYNFHRNGFAFSPETFIHLAPVELKMQIEGYIDTMNSLLRNPNFENIHFVNQYLLNNLDNRKFTPLLDDIEEKNIQNTISFKYDSTNYDSNVSKITKLNNQGDIQWNTTLGIKDKEGKINYYIKNTESSTDNIKEATYSKIDSLGMKNEFQEYSYNTAIEDFKSVIDGSKQEDTFKNPDEESYYNDEDSMENTHQDDIMSSYDSNSLGVDNKEDFFETNNKAVDPDSGEKLC